MTITIPWPVVLITLFVLCVLLAFSKAAGPFRWIGIGLLCLLGAWLVQAAVWWLPVGLAAVGLLSLLGFVDAVRARK